MQRPRMRAKRFSSTLLLGISSIVFITGILQAFLNVKATDNPIDWTNNQNITVEKTATKASDSTLGGTVPRGSYRKCINETVTVVTGFATSVDAKLCVTHGEHIRYAVYDNYTPVVSFGSDRRMYKLLGVSWSSVLVEGTDTFIFPADPTGYFNVEMRIYENVSKYIHRDTQGSLYTQYIFDLNETAPYISSKTNDTGDVHSEMIAHGESENGRFVAWVNSSSSGTRYKLIDLTTKQITTFYGEPHAFDEATPYWPKIRVSNDGKYVAIGLATDIDIWHLGDCGSVNLSEADPFDSSLACKSRHIDRTVIGEPVSGHFETSDYTFSGDNGQFSFYGGPNANNFQLFTLSAPGYVAPRLEYLALGDSYSSGEGDTEQDQFGRKYYTSFTDVEENFSLGRPREKCHVSTRSYPYLLARSMNLALNEPRQWATVACSGAKIWDVKGQASSLYEGQEKQLIRYSMDDLKTQALNEFIPGRQKQIEFVKKYKPKVITLTMGGNDVGFADKIKKCLIFPNTCEYATDESKSSLASIIKDQFDSLKSLYKDLYLASGSLSKIYVLGYPQFINSNKNASCGTNIGFLDDQERQMITAGVSYLNNVIKKATEAAGVKYINIEDSLNGHKLCDGDDVYVTGIAAWGRSENQESFHPNSKGNNAIASQVWREGNVNNDSLFDYNICPGSDQDICPDLSATKDSVQIPVYFQSSQTDQNIKNKTISSKEVKKGAPIDIFLESYTFLPGSTVRITLHSDPVELGRYLVGQDGSLTSTTVIPSEIPVGYHTIIIEGSTYSGELIEYEQTILVLGLSDSDIDEDGISDDIDKCLFLPAINIDIDFDGIDDACDPQINTTLTSQLYDYQKIHTSFDNKKIVNNFSVEGNIDRKIDIQELKDNKIKANNDINHISFDIPAILLEQKSLFIYTITTVTLCTLTAILLISKRKFK